MTPEHRYKKYYARFPHIEKPLPDKRPVAYVVVGGCESCGGNFLESPTVATCVGTPESDSCDNSRVAGLPAI